MGELGALFNPGMRHELEERQAKAARREEEGNAKDGDLRIDLESGIAVISARGGQPGADAEQSTQRPATASDSSSDSASPAPTEAGSQSTTAAARPEAAPVLPADESTESAPVVTGSGPERRRAAPVRTDPAAGPRPRGKRGLSASTR